MFPDLSSTSKYLAAFSQQTCTAAFITMLGFEKSLPAALRLFDQRFFMASVPNI